MMSVLQFILSNFIDSENLGDKLWVNSQGLKFTLVHLLMPVPVSSLRKLFEAASARKWLLPVV